MVVICPVICPPGRLSGNEAAERVRSPCQLIDDFNVKQSSVFVFIVFFAFIMYGSILIG